MAGTSASVPEQAVAVRRGSRALGLCVLCTLLFLTFLDNTIVSVGLGNVQAGLHAGVAGLQWVVQQVIQAAYDAFAAGLHAALYLSAGLVIGAGLLSVITLRRPGTG
jgi:hypothetical protein